MSSPTFGRSTLMTSAPKSASICADHGPASWRLRSSTRMCERGELIDLSRTGGGGSARLQEAAEVGLALLGKCAGALLLFRGPEVGRDHLAPMRVVVAEDVFELRHKGGLDDAQHGG